MRELVEHTEGINRLMARFGVKFGIYKNGEFHEQLFPFDAIPRVITGEDFRILEKGLIQRVDALNLFLKDIYGEKKIIKDQVVPEEYTTYFRSVILFGTIRILQPYFRDRSGAGERWGVVYPGGQPEDPFRRFLSHDRQRDLPPGIPENFQQQSDRGQPKLCRAFEGDP